MNLVDSCGWLEYFSDGPNADFFASAIEDTNDLIVPTICILEVYKKVIHQKDENSALIAVALMQQGRIIDLDLSISINAARISHELGLPLTDSVILATARIHKALIWTQDAHFENIQGIKYKAKSK